MFIRRPKISISRRTEKARTIAGECRTLCMYNTVYGGKYFSERLIDFNEICWNIPFCATMQVNATNILHDKLMRRQFNGLNYA